MPRKAKSTTPVIPPTDLRAARLAAGMTQEMLAELAGVRRATVADIEAGKLDPRYGTLESITRALRAHEREA